MVNSSYIKIQVDDCDWGDGSLQDIQQLLEDVTSQLLRHLNHPPSGRIRIVCNPNESSPITYIRSSPDEDYVVSLTVKNRLWAQFAYQFSHELCHIISGYEHLREAANGWFHESLCETASLFTLGQMAATWQSTPPYPNWSSYAESLASYAQEVILREKRRLPNGISLGEWFHNNESSLLADRYQRELNGLVAVQLLPLFRQTPASWQSVQYLPDSGEGFNSYLASWRASCPNVHQDFVTRIATAFNFSLP